jgi:DNA-directed RNA polymerase specialized sigma24 family protein
LSSFGPELGFGRVADDASVARDNPPLPRGDEFRAFYDRTSGIAFSLAFRITSSKDLAGEVVEAAYASCWAARPGAGEPAESDLLAVVREQALNIAPIPNLVRSERDAPAYATATALRDGLAGIDPLGRRTLELAYFGGISAAQVAELMGEPVQAVRAALRRALLELGALVGHEQESRT